MTNLQILSTITALDLILLIVCSIMVWREVVLELFFGAGIVTLIALVPLGFCTYESYKWSKIPDCIVSTQHTVYWTDGSDENTKVAWIQLEGRTFCQVRDPEAYYTGIGNHLHRTYMGKAEYR